MLVCSEESIRKFVEAYLAGSLTPDLKTANLPEDWDAAPVKVRRKDIYVAPVKVRRTGTQHLSR